MDVVRTAEEADVACLVKPVAPGRWAVSLRSKGATDVAAVAVALGGGGHRLAAGFTGYGEVAEVLAAVRGPSSPAETAPPSEDLRCRAAARVVTIECMSRRPPEPRRRRDRLRTWDRPLVMVPLFVLIAAVGGLFGFVHPRREPAGARPSAARWSGWASAAGARRRGTAAVCRRAPCWWLVPVLVLALVELYAFSRNVREDYPTLSLLADPILDALPAPGALLLRLAERLLGVWSRR